MEETEMLKAVMFEDALIKTFAMSMILGTLPAENATSKSLIIEPFLNPATFKDMNDGNASS